MSRVAVVTGGAGGIGRAVLSRLGRDGYRTVSWDLDGGAEADLALQVDVTDAGSCEAAAERTASVGRLGAVVVNAGILGPVGRLWEMDLGAVRRVLDADLFSVFATLKPLVPLLLRNAMPDRGRIVLMASLQAKEGTEGAGPYAAAKAGVIALAKVLGKELAAEGVLVNAIAPTVVRGPMEATLAPDRRASLLDKIPMRRFAEAEEVAGMVSFLCGPDCTFSTGAVFDLSGGRATS